MDLANLHAVASVVGHFAGGCVPCRQLARQMAEKLRGTGKFRQLWAPNGGTRAFDRRYLTNLKLYVQSFRMEWQ
jgi:hypothetical protein